MTFIIVWVLISAVGTMIAIGLHADAREDRDYVRQQEGRNGREVIAAARVRSSTVRLFVLGSFCAVGVVALARAAGMTPWPEVAWVVRAGLLGSLVAYVWDGFRESKVRGELLRARPDEGGSSDG